MTGVGFFNLEESSVVRGDECKPKAPKKFEFSCKTCTLDKTCNSPMMQVAGKGAAGVMILGDYVSKNDDRVGLPFSGDTGELLREITKELGLNFSKDFYRTHAVKCGLNGKDHNPSYILSCRENLKKDIEKYKPKVILALGSRVMSSIVGDRMSSRVGGLEHGEWAGFTIPDPELGCYVIPTWPPSWIENENDPNSFKKPDNYCRSQLKKHIKMAIKLAQKPSPKPFDYESMSHVLNTPEDIKREIVEALKHDEIVIDYETTGIKPHRAGHKIVASSICYGPDRSVGFEPPEDDPEFNELWKKLLEKGIIAHNSKFEATWSKAMYDTWPTITGDPMLAEHIIKNKGRTGLKLLGYTYCGVIGYDDMVDQYISTVPKELEVFGTNGFNSMEFAPSISVQKYCAIDSLLIYRIHKIQQQKLKDAPSLELFLDATNALARAEWNGLRLDKEGWKLAFDTLNTLVNDTYESIQSDPAIKRYWKSNKLFRPSAADDLKALLFDSMKYESVNKTKTGAPKTDKASLEQIDLPIIKKILTWKKWQKARDTYLKGLDREAVDQFIHPFFNLHNVKSFRSSSDSPNFQNFPKRDKEVYKAIRSILKPHKGHKIAEYDYKALEVSISACYNKDPNLLKYVRDPSTDMHRDTAREIFLKEDITGVERFVAKNGFVFASFYGSYYVQTATALWDMMPDESKEHLATNKGINIYKKFEDHIKRVEDKFWNKRFKVYRDWKIKTYDEYLKKGYIDSYTGFRLHGPMKKNDVLNYAVQGSAFHCLLWTITRVSKVMEKKGMKSKIIGQIHDAGVFSIHPDEEEEVDRLMWLYGTQRIRKIFDWIIVPLTLEKEIAGVDESWADVKEAGTLNFSKDKK